MTKVTDLNIDPSLEESFLKSVKINKKNYDPNIIKKPVVWRKRKLKRLILDSQLQAIADLWKTLNPAAKIRWHDAGAHCGLGGYQLFVKDTSYRFTHNLLGPAAASIYHQFKVLEWNLGLDIQEFYLIMDIPETYTIFVKNPGQKNAYTPTEINISGTPPVTIEFDYNMDLQLLGVYDFMDIWINIGGYKDGVWEQRTATFDFLYDVGWQTFSQVLSPDLDEIKTFYIVIEGYPFTGRILLDNFKVLMNGTNFAFDPNCEHSNEEIIAVDGELTTPWSLDFAGTYKSFGSVYL